MATMAREWWRFGTKGHMSLLKKKRIKRMTSSCAVICTKDLSKSFFMAKSKNKEDDNAWLLIKHNDKFATNDDYDAEEHTAEDSEVTIYLEEKSRKKKKSNNVRQFKHYAPGLSKEKKLSDVIKPML